MEFGRMIFGVFSQSLGSMIYGLNGAIIFQNLPNGFIILMDK